jgi:glycine oxidase
MPGPTIGIIGGGLIGLSAGWRLAQAGFPVTVFERGSFGKEASWAGAGMLAPGGEIEDDSEFAKRALAGRALYRSFVRELEEAAGLTIDYQECGALDLAYDNAEWAALTARAERQTALGISSKRLDPDQVRVFWPRLRTEDLRGALFYPEDAVVDPRDLTTALLAACAAARVELVPDRAVIRLDIRGDKATVHSESGARDFAALVLAAGAWSSSIAVEGVPPLPIAEPVKGHLIGYQQPDQTCNTIVRRGHTYLLQRANGLLIAGASVEHAGWDRSIDASIAAALAREAEFVLPHLGETTPAHTWIGFRPGSDRLQIGSWHSNALYLAYGHFRNGILLAPQTAAELTALIRASWQTP